MDLRSDCSRSKTVWEVMTYFLKGSIKYSIIRDLLPVFNPGATKGTIAIEDKHRTLWKLLNHTAKCRARIKQ